MEDAFTASDREKKLKSYADLVQTKLHCLELAIIKNQFRA
jgi:hypothetical protein